MNTNNDYHYIGAIGEYPITDYIDTTSNILNNNIYITSNTNYNYTSNSCNILQNQIIFTNTLINIKPETKTFLNNSNIPYYITTNDTYIYNNSNNEIRFKIKNGNEEKFFCKIANNGKLYVYIQYNILHPQVLETWYDVADTMSDYYMNLAIINGTLAGYGGDLLYLQTQIYTLQSQSTILTNISVVHTGQINELIALQTEALVSQTLQDNYLTAEGIANSVKNLTIDKVSKFKSNISSLIGIGGLGLAGWVVSGIWGASEVLTKKNEEYETSQYLELYNSINNSNNSNIYKLDVIDSNSLINSNNTFRQNLNYNILSIINSNNLKEKSTFNLRALDLGFNNCNIQTTQFIPSLNTNEIFINNVNINSNINSNLNITSNILNTKIINTSNNLISYTINTSNNLINYTNTTSNANYNISLNNYNLNITNSNQIYLNYNSLRATDEMILSILDSDYCKKSTFLISTNNLINYNSVNYYTYTIDLTKYIRYIQISDITKLSRFKIMASLASSVAVFSYLTECEYTIMMSQSTSIGQTGGFHCRAFGIPEDLNLTKFAPYKFIKTNNIYQLSFISPVQYAKFIITIIDLF